MLFEDNSTEISLEGAGEQGRQEDERSEDDILGLHEVSVGSPAGGMSGAGGSSPSGSASTTPTDCPASPVPDGFVLNSDAVDNFEDIPNEEAMGKGGAGEEGVYSSNAHEESGTGGFQADDENDSEDDEGVTDSSSNIIPMAKISNGARAAASLWSWGFSKAKAQTARGLEQFQNTEVGKRATAASVRVRTASQQGIERFQQTEVGKRATESVAIMREKTGEVGAGYGRCGQAVWPCCVSLFVYGQPASSAAVFPNMCAGFLWIMFGNQIDGCIRFGRLVQKLTKEGAAYAACHPCNASNVRCVGLAY